MIEKSSKNPGTILILMMPLRVVVLLFGGIPFRDREARLCNHIAVMQDATQ